MYFQYDAEVYPKISPLVKLTQKLVHKINEIRRHPLYLTFRKRGSTIFAK